MNSYLVGAFLGDGCIYIGKSSYQFSITAEDYDLCENCNNICGDIFNKTGTIKTVLKNGKFSYHQLVICSKEIVTYLFDLTKNKTIIPPVDNKHDLIRGLMDTDGWICKVNASDGFVRYRVGFKNTADWTPDFYQIVKDIGVNVGKLRYINNAKYNVKDAFTFSINTFSYCENIGFGIKRKQNLAQEYLQYVKNKKHNTSS